MRRTGNGVQVNSIEASVNNILREWRDLWPGGLREEEYSTLNLMALCRQGPLGYNHARCQDYRDEGKTKEMTMSGAKFLRSFARHLVPKSFRRVRYFGLLAGAKGRHRELAGSPQTAISEKTPARPRPACQKCGGCHWQYIRLRHCLERAAGSTPGVVSRLSGARRNRFSLVPPDSG